MFVAQRNVDATTDDEIKGVVARRLADAGSPAVLVEVAVEIAVGATEQNLAEWFEMGGAEFENGTNVVGEQVA